LFSPSYRFLGDFGLGTIIERQRVMSMVGTASHMAPESLSVSYDEKIDIWSFGMCIIEMVTGEELYSECDSPHQIPVLISRVRREKRSRLIIFPSPLTHVAS